MSRLHPKPVSDLGLSLVLAAAVILVALGGLGRSLTGWCVDPEFAREGRLVATWPPRWQWDFRSPVGDSDLTLRELRPDQRRQEIAYQEVCQESNGVDLFWPDWM